MEYQMIVSMARTARDNANIALALGDMDDYVTWSGRLAGLVREAARMEVVAAVYLRRGFAQGALKNNWSISVEFS